MHGIDLAHYTLETLGADEHFVVSRGTPTKGGPPILLVSHAPGDPSPSAIDRIRRSHALRAELDPSWAGHPLALVPYRGREALALQDPGGSVLARLLGRPLPIAQALRIAIGLADSIGKLHARGLIHRDIKPPHIMVEPESGRVWLAGTGLSVRLTRQKQSPEPPLAIAGTLAYMAPEQTGRMNRSLDSRSDLYTFGVILYQMLTGELPFTSTEAMELVHCHVARRPVPPHERVATVPEVVSAIVMKLLAKTAEDRYQTAHGVLTDLRCCLATLEDPAFGPAAGSPPGGSPIAPFPLGRADVGERLLVPEKLYGREREIEALLGAFGRVVDRATLEIVMVSGYSGIGKSSVVAELLKELVPNRGLFASGKFDQYQRDVPFATLTQAFRGLVRGILGESDASLAKWRDAIQGALGTNGQRMIELIPELERVIGKQPPVPELPAKDAAALFQSLFRAFVAVFAKKEHPLALFLDDLQWLDAATLELLEHLGTDGELRYLLLVGAYRDNEVGPNHALALRLESMKKAGAKIHDVKLAPLRFEDLAHLVADAVHAEAKDVWPLARLIYEKTGGNPFFTIQFLSALEDDALVAFDPRTRTFGWDLEKIREKHLTDNVVDLMVRKINRLPDTTREALQDIACLGSGAPLSTLAQISSADEGVLVEALEEAVRAGLVHRSGETFTFLHDRIREAAYALVSDEARPQKHLQIGRRLLAATPASARTERAFDLTNQLNRGVALLETDAERDELCALNIVAARRAHTSTAYASALSYLGTAAGLLPADVWTRDYARAFELGLNRAECEFLTSDVPAAQARLEDLRGRATSQLDRARVAVQRMRLYTAIDDYPQAIAIGIDYLKTIGVTWSATPTKEDVGAELARIPALLGGRAIAAVIDLPAMTDADSLSTFDVLLELAAPALFTNGDLYALCVARQVNISLEHGNCDGSAIAYALAGMLFGAHLGDYATSKQFAELGFALVDQRGLTRFEARVCMVTGHHVYSWTDTLRRARDLTQRGLDVAIQTGDVVYGAYTIAHLISNDYAAGRPLAEVERDCRHGMEFARKGRFMGMFPAFVSLLSFARALRGVAPDFDVFGNEDGFRGFLESDYRLAVAGCGYWTMRQQIRLTLLDYAGAIEAEEHAKKLVWAAMSFFERAEYHTYGAIARAARHDEVPASERPAHLEALRAHHAQLAIWAQTAPETFGNRALLAAAEIARIEGRQLDAQSLYEEAIQSARRYDFVNSEALALERAAAFHAANGYEAIALTYLRAARQCYARWGADAKVQQLETMHPRLAGERTALAATTTIEAGVDQLDLATVIKVSQAIFGEIVLEKLMRTLMVTAVEHAGAERGLLILARDGELVIEAKAKTAANDVAVELHEKPASSAELPLTLLQYVVRTLESVVLEDASAKTSFAGDPYLARNRCRSILCLPLVKQTKLVGVLYLENNLASHVFTAGRIAVLRVLAAQAASSLDNARLVAELERSKAYLARAQELSATGSFGLDVATGAMRWSDETYRLTGVAPGTRPTLDLAIGMIHPDERAAFEAAIRASADDGVDLDVEHRLVRADGALRSFRFVAQNTFNGAGERELIGAAMDVTERKRAEGALLRMHGELAHVTRVATLGEMAASIAHEVNQPLAAISANASACVRWLDRATVGEAREAAQRVARDAKRAAEVVSNLRSLFRKTTAAKEPVDVNKVVGDVLTFTGSELHRHEVTAKTDLASDLPHVLGDRVQLQQVLLNLVLNASEAMRSILDRPRKLTIATRHVDRTIQVSVEDTGPGFSAEAKEKLFEAFHTTKSGGMGMGLSISRSIIEDHGGKIWADVNDGDRFGATFHFALALEADAGSAARDVS